MITKKKKLKMEETILFPRENVARLFKAIQTITMKNSKKKFDNTHTI
jgi:hypothetical protein